MFTLIFKKTWNFSIQYKWSNLQNMHCKIEILQNTVLNIIFVSIEAKIFNFAKKESKAIFVSVAITKYIFFAQWKMLKYGFEKNDTKKIKIPIKLMTINSINASSCADIFSYVFIVKVKKLISI